MCDEVLSPGYPWAACTFAFWIAGSSPAMTEKEGHGVMFSWAHTPAQQWGQLALVQPQGFWSELSCNKLLVFLTFLSRQQ